MAAFTYRLENGDPAPDQVLDAIQARHARLQDLLDAIERIDGAMAIRDALVIEEARTRALLAVGAYKDADAHLEHVATEANRTAGWRSIDLRVATDEPAE